VRFGGIESLERIDARDDGAGERTRLPQLAAIARRDALLRRVAVKNLRAVLRADIWPLAVELGRIVRDRKINPQDVSVRDLLGIENYLHRLGVAGAAASDFLVIGAALLSTRVAGQRLLDALGVLEDTLHA